MTRTCCFLLAVFAQSPSLAEPRFSTIEISNHVYSGGWEHFVGGGVAVFDCNNDDLPELFVAGGTNPAQLFLNTSKDDISFSEATPAAIAQTGVTGAYPLDIDSDGFMDLAILRVGTDLLMRGLGGCEFDKFETLGFVSGDHWTTAFSATWEHGQTLPTLAFGTYVDRFDPMGPFEACDASQLYRPIESSYTDPIPLEPGYCALSILFSDWGRQGHADLRVSNDRHYYVRQGQEQLWSMDDNPRLYGTDDNWQSFSIWGMGIASRDLTGDGFPEVYLTSMGDQKLQQFDPTGGGPMWKDVTFDFGTTAHRPHVGGDGRPSTGWHAQFGDVTNDGRDDIFVAKGNVDQMPGSAMDDPNSLLQQTENGTFEEVSHIAGVASLARSRGAALADLNRDGLLDLVVINRRAPMEVFQNTTVEAGNWLTVELSQDGVNRRGVGSFIEVKTEHVTQTREVTIGGGHAGGQAVAEHFGLGKARQASVRVIWPEGNASDWQLVDVNQALELQR